MHPELLTKSLLNLAWNLCCSVPSIYTKRIVRRLTLKMSRLRETPAAVDKFAEKDLR